MGKIGPVPFYDPVAFYDPVLFYDLFLLCPVFCLSRFLALRFLLSVSGDRGMMNTELSQKRLVPTK